MRRRLSRRTFLKVAVAAAIGLGVAQAGLFAYQKAHSATVMSALTPVASSVQRPPDTEPRPRPVASSVQRPPDPELMPSPVASSIQRPPMPASTPTAVVGSSQQPPDWPEYWSWFRANLG